MLPRFEIQAWRDQAPWADEADVEQDLIITRVLLGLFDDPFLRERLAIRGGTALHKLYLAPAAAGAAHVMRRAGRQVRRRSRSPLQMLRDAKGSGVDSLSQSRMRPVPS